MHRQKNKQRNSGKEKSGNEEQNEKELTFLEKHVKEGLMSKCGIKDREATVFMEMDDASVAAAIEQVLKRKNKNEKDKMIMPIFFSKNEFSRLKWACR